MRIKSISAEVLAQVYLSFKDNIIDETQLKDIIKYLLFAYAIYLHHDIEAKAFALTKLNSYIQAVKSNARPVDLFTYKEALLIRFRDYHPSTTNVDQLINEYVDKIISITHPAVYYYNNLFTVFGSRLEESNYGLETDYIKRVK